VKDPVFPVEPDRSSGDEVFPVEPDRSSGEIIGGETESDGGDVEPVGRDVDVEPDGGDGDEESERRRRRRDEEDSEPEVSCFCSCSAQLGGVTDLGLHLRVVPDL